MERRRVLQGIAGTVGGVLVAGTGAVAFASTKGTPANQEYLPNAELVTHEGKSVRFYDDLTKGKIVLFNVMYVVCEGICPGSTRNLRRVQEALGPRIGRDVFMYSLTLQPESDTPEKLREYMAKNGVGPGWTYLTGKRENTDLIRRRIGFSDPDPAVDNDKKQHTGMVKIGNDLLRRWTGCAAQADVDLILRSIKWIEEPPSRSV